MKEFFVPFAVQLERELDPESLMWLIPGNLGVWQAEVIDKRDRINYGEHALAEYDKQFSLWYYWWMLEANEVNESKLLTILRSDVTRWAAEHVFKVGYREFDYELEDGVLVSPDFANRSLLSICLEGVELRKQAGASTERVEHEGLGVYNLQYLLNEMKDGETAVIMSPPGDGEVGDKGRYNMIYVYEKRGEKGVKATAIRDNYSSLAKMRTMAGVLSENMEIWEDAGPNEMVAVPFRTKYSFEELLENLKVNILDELPKWALEMVDGTVKSMWYRLTNGNLSLAKETFDALQIALFTTKKQIEEMEKKKLINAQVMIINPLQMVDDEKIWKWAQDEFVRLGGMDMREERGLCGGVALDLKSWEKDNNVMSRLMGVDEITATTTEYSFDHEGKCVVCHGDPKMLGPCGICEECDHKLQTQTD